MIDEISNGRSDISPSIASSRAALPGRYLLNKARPAFRDKGWRLPPR
jgi:hypothetical protein